MLYEVITACGEDEPELRLREEADLARGCDRVVAPTARERDHLVRTCGVPEGRVLGLFH